VVSIRSVVEQDPYPFYEQLQEKGEAVWDDELNALLITSYALVRSTLQQDGRDLRWPRADRVEREPVFRALTGARQISTVFGEDHARFHRWWLQTFSSGNVRRWRPTDIKPVVDAMVDRFSGRGHADLVEDLARAVPMRVVASVLGLPWEDDEWLASCRNYVDARTEYEESYKSRREDFDEVGRRAMRGMEFIDRLRVLIEQAHDSDADNVMTMFWRDGPSIFADWDIEDMLAGVTTAIFAGSETTATAAANGMYILLMRPELQEELREKGEEGVERFVEEALRIHGAAHYVERFANTDTEIAGVPVKKNTIVVPLLAAANVDPRRYECPFDVNLERKNPRDHTAFAMGPRSCGGMWLARGELAEMYTAILQRLPDLRLDPDAEPPRLVGLGIRSFKPLNALFTAVER